MLTVQAVSMYFLLGWKLQEGEAPICPVTTVSWSPGLCSSLQQIRGEIYVELSRLFPPLPLLPSIFQVRTLRLTRPCQFACTKKGQEPVSPVGLLPTTSQSELPQKWRALPTPWFLDHSCWVAKRNWRGEDYTCLAEACYAPMWKRQHHMLCERK